MSEAERVTSLRKQLEGLQFTYEDVRAAFLAGAKRGRCTTNDDGGASDLGTWEQERFSQVVTVLLREGR